MPTLDPTIGGSAANSYVSVSDADTYFDERPNSSTWTGETDADKKERALIAATRRLDQEDFEGSPVNPLTGTSSGTTQSLKFPRYDVEDPDGWTYLHSVIPEPLKLATMELALAYLGASSDPLANTGLEGFEEVKLGPITVKPRHSQVAAELPENVLDLIQHMMRAGRGRNQFTIERA